MLLIDKQNFNGWTRPQAFESLLQSFPEMESTIKRNLCIVSRLVSKRIKQIAEVRENRNYNIDTKNFLEQFLKMELENTEFYKRWRWLKRFNDYINIVKNITKIDRWKGYKGKINYLPIEEVRAIPILHLYDFEKIKKIGKRTMACCPLHPNDNTPSFVIYPTNTWYCFSGCCQKGGSSIDFIMHLHNLNFRDAVNYLIKIK